MNFGEQRTTIRQGKRRVDNLAEIPKYRETPMTMPEARLYKEDFRTTKNVQHMRSNNPVAHMAPNPDAHPRAEAKTTARMMKSSIQMFPNEKDTDTFTSGAKRSAAASNQFATSDSLYGGKLDRSAAKKMSKVKIAEIGGSDTVKPLSHG